MGILHYSFILLFIIVMKYLSRHPVFKRNSLKYYFSYSIILCSQFFNIEELPIFFKPEDLFVIRLDGSLISSPKTPVKPSQCTPMFMATFLLAGSHL